MKPFHRSRASLGITRRDFLNGVLLGSGAALLRQQPVLLAGQTPLQAPGPDWYGYGGIGGLCAFPREHTGGACSRTPPA